MTEHWGFEDHTNLDKTALLREAERLVELPIIAAAVTGSHSWALANPDSDIDIRGVYVKPTVQMLSLHPGRDTVERQGAVDVQFYEIEKALGMLQSHNGNVVELLLSPSIFYLTTAGIELQKIVKKYVTKRLRIYYRGYATSQRKRAAENRGGKALVYTFRECFSGIWLMRTGEIEYNFRDLWRKIEEAGIYTSELLPKIFERKKWQVIATDEMEEFNAEWEQLCEILDAEAAKSSLPDDYKDYDELNRFLLAVRRYGACNLPENLDEIDNDFFHERIIRVPDLEWEKGLQAYIKGLGNKIDSLTETVRAAHARQQELNDPQLAQILSRCDNVDYWRKDK